LADSFFSNEDSSSHQTPQPKAKEKGAFSFHPLVSHLPSAMLLLPLATALGWVGLTVGGVIVVVVVVAVMNEGWELGGGWEASRATSSSCLRYQGFSSAHLSKMT
jgi:hypothetical protein